MIAARLAGGNLFLPFLWWGKFLVGDFWSSSEHSDFFWWGIFLEGGFFFLGVVGGVLDCKCWKKLKND